MQDIIAIVAPRPLRLTLHHHQHHPPIPSNPLADALASFHLHDDLPLDPPPPSASSSSSSCASSVLCDESASNSSIQSTPISTSTRLSLPQEALEEFLAISLKRINTRRHTSSSSLPYQRPHPYKMRKSASSGSSSAPDDDQHRRSRRGIGTRSHRILEDDIRSTSPLVQDESPEWGNFSLGSPISRNQTRNPLPRHPALESLTSNLRFSLDPYISPPPLLLASPVVSPAQEYSPEEPQS